MPGKEKGEQATHCKLPAWPAPNTSDARSPTQDPSSDWKTALVRSFYTVQLLLADLPMLSFKECPSEPQLWMGTYSYR